LKKVDWENKLGTNLDFANPINQILETTQLSVLSVPGVYDAIFPPEPEINVTDLNAQDGIIEGNKLVYSYEPRSLIPNGTKNESFYLKISNTGKADAHNFWIIVDSIPNGLWFDFQSSFIIHEGNPTPCQQKSSYCTIGLVPKESSNMVVEYDVEFDHKLYQEIVDETPKLFFNYGFDEGEEQTIELFLKFDWWDLQSQDLCLIYFLSLLFSKFSS